MVQIFTDLAKKASKTLDAEGVAKKNRTTTYQVDIRYHGQGLLLTIDFDLSELRRKGLDAIGSTFDEMHEQLFTFALPAEKELVNLRSVVRDKALSVKAPSVPRGNDKPSRAFISKTKVFMEGKSKFASLYDRSKLKQGNVIKGPAIVLEMDSTTVVLPGHSGRVDKFGNILITPDA